MKITFIVFLTFSALAPCEEKPRVFITDSQSWETHGSAGGTNGTFAAESHGGARPQTAEIIKTFGERCPQAIVNMKPDKADYVVTLDHEGGKGLLRHKNKVAVFNNKDGDSIFSHSTLSLGGSVQGACEAIVADWSKHLPAVSTPDASNEPKTSAPPAAPIVAPEFATVNFSSQPDGADIELDGNFVGNTPSSIKIAAGQHTFGIKKSGYKDWQKQIQISSGEIHLSADLEKNP